MRLHSQLNWIQEHFLGVSPPSEPLYGFNPDTDMNSVTQTRPAYEYEEEIVDNLRRMCSGPSNHFDGLSSWEFDDAVAAMSDTYVAHGVTWTGNVINVSGVCRDVRASSHTRQD